MAEDKGGAVKTALLNELKIDRGASRQPGGGHGRWLLLLSLVLVAVFAGWFFTFTGDSAGLIVNTAVARAPTPVSRSSSVLDATGYVVARRQATVSAKTTGKVLEVLIEEGMQVSEGQLLARLDDSVPRAELALARSRLDAARAGLEELRVAREQAELDLNRTRELAGRNLASQADLDRDRLDVDALQARLASADKEIIVAERNLGVQQQLVDDMQIRAPFAGVVIAKAAQPGEMISPVSAGGGFTRTGICTIVDMASLEVEVDVNESYINRVFPGQRVEVILNAYPDVQYPAEVIAIIPAADRNKATVRVRVGFIEKDERVLPDMGVRVAFLEESESADTEVPAADLSGALVPEAAVARDEYGEFVFVIVGSRADRRPVTTAGQQGSQVRISSGLSVGERVVAGLSEDMLAKLERAENITVAN